MDDLVKRLASWGTAAGLGTHFLGTKSAREDCAEAAAALSEAQATIARLEAALRRCPPTSNPNLSAEEHVERIEVWWRNWARPALSSREGEG